jgi:predicted porin
VGAGIQYSLSKRTAIYTQIGYQRAAGQTLSGKVAIAAPASVGDAGFQSASGSQFLSVVGITHRF